MASEYGGKLSPRALREKADYIREVAATLKDKQVSANLLSYALELEAEAAALEAKDVSVPRQTPGPGTIAPAPPGPARNGRN